MTSDFNNFKAWYKDTLEKLYPNRNSGFAILMIAFPLLERYLRHKNGLSYKDNLNKGCMDELCNLFPILTTNETARKFWHVFRNGILHQVALLGKDKKGSAMPDGWLSHDIDKAIKIGLDESLIIHPVLFTKHIVEIIENDFEVFEKVSTVSIELPKVKPHPTETRVDKGEQSFVLGTNTEK